MLGEKLWGYQ